RAGGKGELAPKNVAEPPAPGTAPVASAPEPLSPSHPLDSRYDFPSSASIPPVSIMNVEPPPPKEPASPQRAHAAREKTGTTAPVPPKRPQSQAVSPPAH